jgi:hypothetical protein
MMEVIYTAVYTRITYENYVREKKKLLPRHNLEDWITLAVKEAQTTKLNIF